MSKNDDGVIFTVNPGSTSTKCALFYLRNNKIERITEETIKLEKNMFGLLLRDIYLKILR